jgi:phosphinothricin acetyltransferase
MANTALIRDAQPEDAATIAAIYAPFVTGTPISFEREAPGSAEIARRMVATQEAYPYLVAEANGEVVAYAYAGPYRPRHAYRNSVEVTAYANPGWQGLGIGAALYMPLLGRLTATGFHTALAIITLPNARSVSFHERLGFSHAGTLREVGSKFGNWYDTGIWQRKLKNSRDREGPTR